MRAALQTAIQRAGQLGAREKRIVKWVGYPLLALIAFLFALGWTFPYDRLRERAIDALSDKYDVTIADVHGTVLPGGAVFEMVMLKTRPAQPDEKPVVLLFEEVVIDVSILELLLGHVDVDLEASIGAGTIDGNVEVSSSALEASIETEELPLSSMPGVAAAVGLPMEGKLDLALDVRLPGRKWKDAEGSITLRCPGCTVGDGVSTLKPRVPEGRRLSKASAFDSQGVTVPRLSLGDLHAEIEIRKGVGTFKSFAAKSADGWLKFDGKLELRDPIGQSLLPGCMTFFLSEELRKREPTFANITVGMSKHLQPDGSFALPTKGKLTPFAFDAKKQCGGGAAGGEPDIAGGIGGRPELGVPGGDEERPGRGERRGMDDDITPPGREGRGEEEPRREPYEPDKPAAAANPPPSDEAPSEPPRQNPYGNGPPRDENGNPVDPEADRDVAPAPEEPSREDPEDEREQAPQQPVE